MLLHIRILAGLVAADSVPRDPPAQILREFAVRFSDGFPRYLVCVGIEPIYVVAECQVPLGRGEVA